MYQSYRLLPPRLPRWLAGDRAAHAPRSISTTARRRLRTVLPAVLIAAAGLAVPPANAAAPDASDTAADQTVTVASGRCAEVRDTRTFLALTTDSTIYIFDRTVFPGQQQFIRYAVPRIPQGQRLAGELIGIDVRPADGLLYGVTDGGRVYRFDLRASEIVSDQTFTLSFAGPPPRFDAGLQSLADFNANNNGLRLIGSNGLSLGVTLVPGNPDPDQGVANGVVAAEPPGNRTVLRYASNDPIGVPGVTPRLTAGAYDKNARQPNGPQTTLFNLDYDLEVLTVQRETPLSAANQSNQTNRGVNRTIGRLRVPTVGTTTVPLPIPAVAGMDIAETDDGGEVMLLGIGQSVFCVDMATINAMLPTTFQGVAQDVTVTKLFPADESISDPTLSGKMTDLAVLLKS